MCIAIFKPESQVISKETLAQCFKANSDGAGFMYVEKGIIKIKKGYFNFDAFYEAYLPHENKQCVIHFRIKTHGEINEENCHPFKVDNTTAFIHNGVISNYGNTDYSDTYMFNEEYLKPLVAEYGIKILQSPQIKKSIESLIGFSKLVFLFNNNESVIYNESKGVWDAGVWYSNTSYKIYVPPPTTYIPRESNVHYIANNNKPLREYNPTNPYASTRYYLPREYGEDIHVSDICKVSVSNSRLFRGQIVEVIYISKRGFVDVEDATGKRFFGIPGNNLDFYCKESDLERILDSGMPRGTPLIIPDNDL
jgi:hypothetical protein